MRSLVLATSLALPTALWADCAPPVLSLSGDTATLIGVEEGTQPTRIGNQEVPPGHTIVIDADNDRVLIVDPAKGSLEELLLAEGKPNVVYDGPDKCRVPDTPVVLPDGRPVPPLPELFPAGDPGRAPEELFADAGATCSNGPRSGLWRAEIGATRIEGCPALMQQMFQSSAALPGIEEGQRQMRFACPFHPDTLEMSRTTRVRWQDAGPNRWTTTDLAAEIFAQIPAGQGGGSQIRWTMTLVSPEEFTIDRDIELVLPAAAAAMMGQSAEGCRVTGTDRWLRIGD